MKKKYSKKKGPVRAKKVSFDGIQFQSGLELYMYKALKEAEIVAEYEPTSYTLLEGFDLNGMCFEKQANGKGEYKDREVSSFFFVHCFNYYKYVWYCNHKFASVLIRGPVQGLDSQFDICLRTQLDEI